MPVSSPTDNLGILRRYLHAIESGTVCEGLTEFFSDEVTLEIFPSIFFAKGNRSDLAGTRASANRAKEVMSSQRYAVKNAIATGDQVAVEVDWTGTLAVPFQHIPAGGQMRAHFAMFLEFRDGKIVAQRNYDCYESD